MWCKTRQQGTGCGDEGSRVSLNTGTVVHHFIVGFWIQLDKHHLQRQREEYGAAGADGSDGAVAAVKQEQNLTHKA